MAACPTRGGRGFGSDVRGVLIEIRDTRAVVDSGAYCSKADVK